MSDTKTIRQVLEAAEAFLKQKKAEEPLANPEALLACLLKCRRTELRLRYSEPLSEKHLDAMRRGVKRLGDGEPVQYIIGSVEFMNHTFKTDRRALIPRPETELLVEQILSETNLPKAEKLVVMDIGTGSGCIVISLAIAAPQHLYLGYDVSTDALQLARENAAALAPKTAIAFTSDDLSDVIDPATVNLIVANLPYIPSSDCNHLPRHIKDFEPRLALDGGPDGLAIISGVIQDSSILLAPAGRLYLEIGHNQASDVQSLMEEAGFAEIQIRKDTAGHDRIVSCLLPG